MACVKQWQRRAIERLKPHARPLNFPPTEASLLMDGQPLYVLGVSDGTGTCSDIHGMDVLVLGLTPPSVPPRQADLSKCSYAVLLRWATDEERRRNEYCNSAVDLLEVLVSQDGQVTLGRSGYSAVYSAIV